MPRKIENLTDLIIAYKKKDFFLIKPIDLVGNTCYTMSVKTKIKRVLIMEIVFRNYFEKLVRENFRRDLCCLFLLEYCKSFSSL